MVFELSVYPKELGEEYGLRSITPRLIAQGYESKFLGPACSKLIVRLLSDKQLFKGSLRTR